MALASASQVSSMPHHNFEGHTLCFIIACQLGPHVQCSAMHLSTLWLHPAKSLHLVQAALEKEIKDTLASWQQLLARADRIFVQASVRNARPIYGGDNAALKRHDPRVRSIPFNTR